MNEERPISNMDLDFEIALSHKGYDIPAPAQLEEKKDVDNNKVYQESPRKDLRREVPHDVNLVAEGTIVPAHKSVLAAVSDYFRAMFEGGFAEANRKEIPMPAITLEGLNDVLNAIYTGKLYLTNRNVFEVLDTADQLQVQDVTDCCEDFMILGTDVFNCFQLLQLSEKYTLPRLNQEIEQFVLRNFTQVCEHNLFPSISQDAVITFISNDELDFKEIDIFRAVMNWFKDDHNDEKRRIAHEVMKHMRFTYMESVDIQNEVLPQPIIADNEQCKSHVEDALRYVISYEENVYARPILEASNTEKPRGKLAVITVPPKHTEGDASRMLNVPAVKQLLVLGFNDNALDMSDMTVCESQVDFAVFSMNILHLGNSLFFLGAHPTNDDGSDAEMVLLRFNVQSGEWTTLKEPDFPALVVSVSILHENYIYIFGGAAYSNKKTIPQSTFKKTCYRYSIADNKWSQLADYPHPVSHPATCVIGQDIYVVGGGGTNVDTWDRDRVFAYSIQDDKWTEKCPLTNGRAGHRVCALNGKIYVLGGRDPYRKDIPDCEVYDPEQDLWTELNNAPVPRPVASYAMLVHNNNITLIGGGCDKETRHAIVQTLNTTELSWTSYSWKNDHPHLLLSGSIHQLPLLRVRLSCCAKYNDGHPSGINANGANGPNESQKQIENKSANNRKQHKISFNTRHCSVM